MGKTNIIISAEDKTKQAFDSVGKNLSNLKKGIGAGDFLSLKSLGIAGGIAGFSALSDAGTKLTGILKNSSGAGIDMARSFEDVKKIAAAAQTDIVGVGTTYARIANSVKDLGATQKEVATITETLSLALKVNGATAEEASSTLLQLSQAFGKGKLDGDEFRTAMEAAPNVMRELAKSMGVPFGALKDLAAQGQITSEVLIKAFGDSTYLNSLRTQAKEMQTIGGALTEVKNSAELLVLEFNKMTGASGYLAKGIHGIAIGLSEIADGFKIARTAGVGFFGSILAYTTNESDIAPRLDAAAKRLKELKKELSGSDNRIEQTFLKGQILDQEKLLKTFQNLEDLRRKRKQVDQGPNTFSDTKKSDASLQAFLNDKSFDTKSDKTKKELLELSEAFMAATKDVDTTSAPYLAALKRVKEKAAEILGSDKKSEKKTNEDEEAAANFIEKLKKEAETLELTKPQLLEYDAAHLKLSESQQATTKNLIGTIKAYEDMAAATKEWAEQENLLRDAEQRDTELADENQATEDREFEEREAAFDSLKQTLEKENEELNINLLSSDKKRARAQLDLEHARNVERIQGMISEGNEVQELLDQETANFELRIKQLDETKNAAKELGLTFTSAFEDAVVGGKNLSEVLQSLLEDVAKFSLRKGFTEPALDLLSGFDLGSLFSFGGSGLLPDFVPSFAVGSDYVPHDMIAQIHKGERIVPAAENSGYGGNTTISISVDAKGSSVEGDGKKSAELGRLFAGVVQAELIKQKRPGGILATV